MAETSVVPSRPVTTEVATTTTVTTTTVTTTLDRTTLIGGMRVYTTSTHVQVHNDVETHVHTTTPHKEWENTDFQQSDRETFSSDTRIDYLDDPQRTTIDHPDCHPNESAIGNSSGHLGNPPLGHPDRRSRGFVYDRPVSSESAGPGSHSVHRPGEISSRHARGKPSESSDLSSDEDLADASAKHSDGDLRDPPLDHPDNHSSNSPAERPDDRPSASHARHPDDHPSNSPAKKPDDHPSDSAAKKSDDHPSNRPAKHAYESSSDSATKPSGKRPREASPSRQVKIKIKVETD